MKVDNNPLHKIYMYRVRKRNCHPLMKAKGDSYDSHPVLIFSNNFYEIQGAAIDSPSPYCTLPSKQSGLWMTKIFGSKVAYGSYLEKCIFSPFSVWCRSKGHRP